MRRLLHLTFVLFAGVASAEDGALSDGEIWNAGVALYEQGNVTNAVSTLDPLLMSLQWSARRNAGKKAFCARVAELVAKMKYDLGDREGAAAAARIALWANPKDARTNRNFTRAVDRLPELREEKRLEAALKAAQGKDPGTLLQAATADARRLLTEAGCYRTNAAPKAVQLADALEKRAARLADAWPPLRETIAQAVTNEEEAATILAQLDQAQTRTRTAARELGDLSADAYGTVSGVEHDFTRFLKLVILPPAAVDEGIVCQSNAWLDAEAFNGRSWQRDALDYTRAFRAKFPAWARAYEQQAQADTNKPPFKAEDQAKVSALATEAEKLQLECCEKSLPPNQEKALDLLRQIRDLLPKDKSGGQGGSQNPSANPNRDKQDDRDKRDDQDRNDRKDEQQPSDRRQDQDPSAEPKEDEKEDAGGKDEPEKDEQELEAILKKAQERNDEHEAEKKARMLKAPLPPNERDW